ncbi:hypothetical protein HN960_01035 [Candidatus Peregrinibacteria bacterium]|jgi:cell division septum initiation protein DivIVA|nr:hypothetical protein [Candidatus Peregrinibacteria bacterium]MBT4586062.1 hypothetical protein [Candidatus Peregrinibacteria bacterium]MBT6731131.1 hypothetical protein [Candidatus Peregrinibacteria bacterium]MBT7009006.1 hypothetical protein [Candidatus Peregrinibacteria bacterium]MBT7345198.1 hypothetical protein [Candidatus Peregrinibacteria bacterium]
MNEPNEPVVSADEFLQNVHDRTIDPAKREAEQLLADAKESVRFITEQAKAEAERIVEAAKEKEARARDRITTGRKQAVITACAQVMSALEQTLHPELSKLVKASAISSELLNGVLSTLVDQKIAGKELLVSISQSEADSLQGELVRKIGDTVVKMTVDNRLKDIAVITSSDGEIHLAIDSDELTRVIESAIPLPKILEE